MQRTDLAIYDHLSAMTQSTLYRSLLLLPSLLFSLTSCSGIDYTHPAFGGCTAINEPFGRCRVVAGYDFVGDEFETPTDPLQPNPDPVSISTTVSAVQVVGYGSSVVADGVGRVKCVANNLQMLADPLQPNPVPVSIHVAGLGVKV